MTSTTERTNEYYRNVGWRIGEESSRGIALA